MGILAITHFKQLTKNNKGQSLVELLVAMFILVVVFLTISLLSVKSVQMSQESLDRQKALSIVKNVSEIIRQKKDSVDWITFVDEDYCETDFDIESKIPEVSPTDGDYSLELICSEVNNVKIVEVKVNWGDNNEHEISENLQFYNY